MKIWEKIIERSIREETIGEEQQVIEKHQEKRKELHMLFIDLEKPYDCVPRQEMWRCMMYKGVPEKYVRTVQNIDDNSSSWTRQGSALGPYIFDLVMDVLSESIREPALWSMLFADDIVLNALEERGLKISLSKTEYLCLGAKGIETVEMDRKKLQTSNNFKYLGSNVSSDENLDFEITCRIQAGWSNWRSETSMLYGTDTWATVKSQCKRMKEAEMKMLRWMCGVSKLDHIKNNFIRGTVKGGKVLDLEVVGRRGKGRPRGRWMDCMREDLREKQLNENDIWNRAKWKTLARNVDPHMNGIR
ncbi:hypothetical protein PR048_029141 [Dryococelus australis]|uniref:Reverse transcriptase domain-containing protein n=1 Tax=Dryococelus australis TaxID=614101 RepID=A0ABQ9GCJ1_9NEOP|nr:hypothetical protein PR048_029141 [Dryococelus australis]